MRLRKAIILIVLWIIVGATVAQGQEARASGPPGEALRVFLRNYLSMGGKVPPDKTTKIVTVRVQAESGSVEDIVYVSGRRWCGSGGCTLLILEPSKSTFKLLGKVTIVQLPVRLLPSAQYDHPDIGVIVHGGGIVTGYQAVLSFNGDSYPGNPSLPPAQKVPAAQGRVIIANTDRSVPLYD